MNFYKFSLLAILLFLNSCSYDQDDKLSAVLDISTVEVIRSDSDLYDNIKDITNDEDRPDESIACIDFIYPLTLFIFDDTDAYVSTNFIVNDEQFSTLLDNLDIDYSISISFPIKGTLESGEELIITTKEELKVAIGNCLNEEELVECNAFIQSCALKIGYSYNCENPYLGGYFYENDGFTTLSVGEELLFGSWSPLIIEDELHINISLINAAEIGEFFNFDWKVTYLDENSLLLTNDNRELVLHRRCDTDFEDCGNFIFEECELIEDEGISEFILDDYSECIYDTLELDDEFPIVFYNTIEDAQLETNAILSNDVYNNIDVNQTVYVRINEIPEVDDNGEAIEFYVVMITLASISCN
ncbi:hypothetical protein ES692_05180 [Psychroserpens burtonensis]|uniref:Uncharacterized protein n=1 Tax=Psychroserpens burtonensis TaxID=49278 RepID=A0A5C7B8W6_9FLAO|nr:hypothetical protein [Psychroserpens burtonensis]TXE18846.1 hypothetical protein ES692_05180 [Psychroserpens burtonensis]